MQFWEMQRKVRGDESKEIGAEIDRETFLTRMIKNNSNDNNNNNMNETYVL